MKRFRDEEGQVIVLTVLCMAVLMGFVAFAADVGIMLHAKSELQSAVDSAALAGAAELKYNDWDFAAKTDAAQNGVIDGTNATVTVHNPPSTGPHASNTNYVEVIATQVEPTFFMKLFNQGSMTVTARAVGTVVSSPTCIYTLDPAPPLDGTGVAAIGGNLKAQNCRIEDGAGGSNAMSVAGGGSIEAKSISVVGNANGSPMTPSPVVGIPAVSDPLTYLAPPVFDPASCITGPPITGTATLQDPEASPGGVACYNTLTISAGANVTMLPGVYVINGSNIAGGDFALQIDTGATVTGTGVTIYLANGSFTSIGANLNLTAPTSDPYNGILFYQNPGDAQPDSFIGGSVTLTGIVYLPGALLNLSQGASASFDLSNVSLVIGSLRASQSVTIQGYGPGVGFAPAISPSLTE